jgi:hypothetical protein
MHQVRIRLLVRFKVHKAASMKMTVFRDVALCSLVETDRDFIDAYCLQSKVRLS